MRVPWAVLLPALLAAGSCCYAPAACASQEPASAVDPKPAGPPANPKESEKPAVAPRAAEKVAAKMPPLKGSHIAEDNNYCLQCHTTADSFEGDSKHAYVALDALKKDVHYQKGVNCVDCHGGDPAKQDAQAHQTDDFRSKLPQIEKYCAHCHSAEVFDLGKSEHSAAGPKNALGEGTPMGCVACHGQPPLRTRFDHALLPVNDAKSPVAVSLQGQVQTCGRCHEDHTETFLRSVHGQGIEKMGLSVGPPACANCHGAHNVFLPTDDRSTLHVTHIADTCGKCHNGIEDRLRSSVHARGGLGGQAGRPAPGGKTRQEPTCTSCHRGHALSSPESVAFRESEPSSCGNCHSAMSSSYALSIHGQLTALGYGPAAKCADCHGAHDVLPLDDANSRLALPDNRMHTCGKAGCHAGATANFVSFNPHLDPFNATKFPLVHAVQVALLTLLFSTFAFFGVHSLLWFVRGLVEVLRHGRPHGLRPGGTAYVRFVSFHRIGHTIMMSSFLGLALTGLPLKYKDASWAQSLAQALGGFQNTSFWHRFFGVILLASMLVYMARMVRLLVQGRKQGGTMIGLLFGSDSPLPGLRDLKDFLKMLRWFFGLGPRPGFDRWSYWEKIDFWGAIADTVIIGTTGLMLWFPNFFCLVLPGTALNIAQVIHSTQALLATGFVFAIHFFNTHLRPDRFPADMSVLTGLVSEEEFKEDRPEYFQRLEREGKLDALRTASPGLFVLWSIRTFGFLALAVGLALLLGMIVALL
jgi:cytochrome b subunit of formate dehydrogenase/nitrate/TMAO reductase-like tetraheme cytochrome c subunit